MWCAAPHTRHTAHFNVYAADQSTFYAKKSGFDYFQPGWLNLKPSLFPSGPSLAEPINLDINPDLKNMINSDSSSPHQPVYQPTKPVAAPIKTFEPSKG